MSGDVEHTSRRSYFVKGYASLATFIASDIDHSTAIYRRFDRLSARNLLYLQSDLVRLEAIQDALDAESVQSPTVDPQNVDDWQTLKEKAKLPENPIERQRLDVALEIQKKLREYKEAMVLEHILLPLKGPSSRTLGAFRNVFNNVGPGGTISPALGGHEARLLDDKNDLIALQAPQEEDRLTEFFRYFFPIFFVKYGTDHELAYISERRLHIAVAMVNVVLVAAILFGAIYNLYYVKDEQKRLGLVAGYTIAFAACVGLVSKARTSEVFAACAAYAAVLVVFVSGGLGSSGRAIGVAGTG